MNEAILTLLATLLGFVLSELFQIRREKSNEQKTKRSLRKMLSLEINVNLSILREFWNSIVGNDDFSEDENLHKEKLARKFLDMPISNFSKNFFESQMHLLPNALTETEIMFVYKHYDRVKKVETIRNKLGELAGEQKSDWNLVSGGSRIVPLSDALGLP